MIGIDIANTFIVIDGFLSSKKGHEEQNKFFVNITMNAEEMPIDAKQKTMIAIYIFLADWTVSM